MGFCCLAADFTSVAHTNSLWERGKGLHDLLQPLFCLPAPSDLGHSSTSGWMSESQSLCKSRKATEWKLHISTNVAVNNLSWMSCIRGQYIKRNQSSRLSFPVLARRVAPCIALQSRDDPTTAPSVLFNPIWCTLDCLFLCGSTAKSRAWSWKMKVSLQTQRNQ